MRNRIVIALSMLATAASFAQQPEYTADGQLMRPANYREWVWLSSGLGMTYSNGASDLSTFDNVFAAPSAYREFLATGKWPDKTMLVLELRASSSHASINKNGYFQSDLAGVQIEVKDEKRFPEKWAFFGFAGTPGKPATTGRKVPDGSACHTCHSQNGAVDNTFVQFYPTLLPVAESKRTLRASYEAPTPTTIKFYQIVAEHGWPEASKVYADAKAKDPEAPLFKEAALNRVAYQLMSSGKKTEAVALLEMLTSTYPQSANAYDSLADAYASTGDKAKAIAASQKALQLVGSDASLSDERRDLVRKSVSERLEKLKGD